MTVIFTAELRSSVGYAITCGCTEATKLAPRYGDYCDARDVADRINAAGDTRAPLRGCEMPEVCVMYPLNVDRVDPDGEVPFVEFSNDNVIGVLDALGLPSDDAYGKLSVEDFRARVLVALGLAPQDAGRPDIRIGRSVVLGRPEGYLQQRLRELHELADWCAAHKRDVVWR